jgi:broad specificity phosphatase PhoE
MKYLIFVKHSLPQIVENVPARKWKLSADGKVRAQLLAERLQSYQPEIVVSSIEPKAVETAEIIAHARNLKMQIMQDLHEHDRSNVAYLSRDEFESAVQNFFDHPNELVFGNETANQSHQRFHNAVNAVLNKFINQTIVIIAHGTVISLFVSRRTGASDFSLWSELGLPSFVVLDMQSNTLVAKENIV